MGSELTESTLSLRDDLITTAVKFLSNPNIQRSPLDQKQKFLRSKGLTDEEISKAFERGAAMLGVPAVASSELLMFRHSRSTWVRDMLFSLILFGGISYGLYWIYKKWLESLFFGYTPKKKSVEEKICDLEKMLQSLMREVKEEIVTVRSEVDRLSSMQSCNTVSRGQIEGLKTDIASVKGILLNRNQFPSLNIRAEPPSIPAWQLQSRGTTGSVGASGIEDGGAGGGGASAQETTPTEEGERRGRGRRSESGGSNSSEGEAATKNSDSSLEIISYHHNDIPPSEQL